LLSSFNFVLAFERARVHLLRVSNFVAQKNSRQNPRGFMNVNEMSAEEYGALPAPDAWVKMFDLADGATWNDVLVRATEIFAEDADPEIEQIVNAAIRIDGDGYSKLWPDEREWAMNVGRGDGVEVLATFVKHRQKITPGLRHLRQKCEEIKNASISLDPAQRHVNAQLGVTDATFLKYFH
jgi:phage I-like protein